MILCIFLLNGLRRSSVDPPNISYAMRENSYVEMGDQAIKKMVIG